MSDRVLYCYDYVNQPYPRVRDIVLANPNHVFQRATAAAASEAAELHVRFAGVDFGKEVSITVTGVEHGPVYDRPGTKLQLHWQATENPKMFPSMSATFVMFPLSATETQLELRGAYDPPMGKFGEVLDAAAGHRLAEASVARFIKEVAAWLREQLAGSPPVDENPVSQPPGVDTEC